MKKTILILLIAAMIGCGKNKKHEESDPAVPVDVVSPSIRAMSYGIRLSSTISSEGSIDIVSESTGEVEKILVEEGMEVRTDTPLAILDKRDLVLAENSAKADFEKASSDWERSQRIYKEGLISKKDLEQVQFTNESARISLERAKLALSKATIKSPIDGIIAERRIKRGDLVKPSMVVFTVTNLKALHIDLFVPEKEIGKLKKGLPAKITSDSYSGRIFEGKIERISPVVDATSGTVKVTVYLESSGILKPGMFVGVNIVLDDHPKALVIPKKALVYEGEQIFSFTYNGGKAHKNILQTGYYDNEWIEIIKGIMPSDKIIVVGQTGLKEGTPVKIEKPQ